MDFLSLVPAPLRIPPEALRKIIAPTAGGAKQEQAYNLCDGETPQAEVGKRVKLDKGNLSRSIARWIEAGIVIRVGAEEHRLHLYPLPPKSKRKAS